jgi:hypothetical protein
MSLPLLHSPADIVRQLLINLGVGGDPDVDPLPDWPVYEDKEPTSPDEVITVYDTTPKSDGRSMVDGETWLHYGLQIRVRGVDKPSAYAKTESVRRSINEQIVMAVVNMNGTHYLVPAICNTNMVRVGQQSPATKRFIYTINGTAAIIRQN